MIVLQNCVVAELCCNVVVFAASFTCPFFFSQWNIFVFTPWTFFFLGMFFSIYNYFCFGCFIAATKQCDFFFLLFAVFLYLLLNIGMSSCRFFFFFSILSPISIFFFFISLSLLFLSQYCTEICHEHKYKNRTLSFIILTEVSLQKCQWPYAQAPFSADVRGWKKIIYDINCESDFK